jgi:hypothetical protein
MAITAPSAPDTRPFLRVAGDAAAILVIFSAMLNAWLLLGVAAAALIGLSVYSWTSKDPARHRFVLVALVAAIMAGLISAGLAWTR